MKKLKNSVKIILVTSISLVCVAAIVLGCIFGLRKKDDGGGFIPSKPSGFTASQQALANEINSGIDDISPEVYDVVPYAQRCSYEQLTMFGKNYFAYKRDANHEEFYAYKINENGEVSLNHITAEHYAFVTVSDAASYKVSSIKENYVVLKTTYQATNSSKYSLSHIS